MPEFIRVAGLEDVPNHSLKKFEVNGNEILIVHSNGKIYATGSYCSHEMGPLQDGDLQESTLMCPLHGAVFELSSGEPQTPPAFENIKVYEIKIEGNDILVKL